MRKCLSLVLCAALLLSLMPGVAATGDEFAIVCEDVTCTPGGQATVAVNVVNNPGFMYLALALTYPEELTLVEANNGQLIADLTKGNQYIWVADEDVTADGLLMTLTFDVAADAAVGEYAVGVDVKQCANYGEQEVTVAAQNGTVTVAEASMTIACEDVTCEPGEEVTVKVSVVDNPGFMYLSATLTYSQELTLVSVANGELIADMTKGNQYIWVADADVKTDGLLMTLTFKVAESVPVGSYSVGVDVKQCANYNEREVSVSVRKGTVLVDKLPATEIDQFDYETTGTDIAINEYTGDATVVVIGDSYEIGGVEYTVTEIAPEAFVENATIERVVLPDTIKNIGEYAFYSCENLKELQLNEGLETIGEGAFSGCELTDILLPRSVASVGELAFYNCVDMTSIIILNKDAEFGDCAVGYVYGGIKKPFAKKDEFVIKGHKNSSAQAYADAEGIAFQELLRLSGASLTLQSDLAVNYKVDKAVFEEYGYENPTLTLQMNGQTVEVDDFEVKGESYVLPFCNVAPNQMNDTITATLKATLDGEEYVCQEREYSVAEYCYGMLGEYASNEYAELRTLLVDLLNYGAASQAYTDYKADDLVNAELTAQQLAWGTDAEPSMSTVLNTAYATVTTPTVQWKGAGLNLNDAVTLRLKFAAQNIDGLSVKIESESGVWTIPASQFEAVEDGVYCVYFNELDAGMMRQSLYLTVCDGETPVSNTVRYSIASYAYEMKDSAIPGLADLVKAMMKYGDSAYAYAN